jgi:uncharacterized protein (UPF0248 family)
MQLKDLFAKYRFSDKKNLSDLKIVIRHRGARNDQKVIPGDKIEVHRGYFTFEEAGEETTIPFHRILIIKEGRKVIYKKASASQQSSSS